MARRSRGRATHVACGAGGSGAVVCGCGWKRRGGLRCGWGRCGGLRYGWERVRWSAVRGGMVRWDAAGCWPVLGAGGAVPACSVGAPERRGAGEGASSLGSLALPSALGRIRSDRTPLVRLRHRPGNATGGRRLGAAIDLPGHLGHPGPPSPTAVSCPSAADYPPLASLGRPPSRVARPVALPAQSRCSAARVARPGCPPGQSRCPGRPDGAGGGLRGWPGCVAGCGEVGRVGGRRWAAGHLAGWGVVGQRRLAGFTMRSVPTLSRRTSGTRTEPSGCWNCSRIAGKMRLVARAEPLSVWTKRLFLEPGTR